MRAIKMNFEHNHLSPGSISHAICKWWCLGHKRGLNYEKSCFLPDFAQLLKKTEPSKYGSRWKKREDERGREDHAMPLATESHPEWAVAQPCFCLRAPEQWLPNHSTWGFWVLVSQCAFLPPLCAKDERPSLQCRAEHWVSGGVSSEDEGVPLKQSLIY